MTALQVEISDLRTKNDAIRDELRTLNREKRETERKVQDDETKSHNIKILEATFERESVKIDGRRIDVTYLRKLYENKDIPEYHNALILHSLVMDKAQEIVQTAGADMENYAEKSGKAIVSKILKYDSKKEYGDQVRNRVNEMIM